MEKINMNGIKIDNINGVDVAKAPTNKAEINEELKDTLKDTQETAQENEAKVKVSNKHVIIYIGSSEYTDGTGHKWHKNDEKTYDESEYANRVDLHFMVNYGEMKHTVVTI